MALNYYTIRTFQKSTPFLDVNCKARNSDEAHRKATEAFKSCSFFRPELGPIHTYRL